MALGGNWFYGRIGVTRNEFMVSKLISALYSPLWLRSCHVFERRASGNVFLTQVEKHGQTLALPIIVGDAPNLYWAGNGVVHSVDDIHDDVETVIIAEPHLHEVHRDVDDGLARKDFRELLDIFAKDCAGAPTGVFRWS